MERTKDSKVTGKQIRDMEERAEGLSEEQQVFHGRRMELYKLFKAGQMDKDSFLKKKTEVLKREEECLEELEALKLRIEEQKNELHILKEGADTLRKHSLMENYDCDVINQLISRVDFFNDGHIRIKWNYEAELGETEDGDAMQEDSGNSDKGIEETSVCAVNYNEKCHKDCNKGCKKSESVIEECGSRTDIADMTAQAESHESSESENMSSKVAVYTSDMFLMPNGDDQQQIKNQLITYAGNTFHIKPEDIALSEDTKDDYGLFFREGYMKFIDMGRTGKADILLIRSFKDLYLSNLQMNDLMLWILPKLTCRLIAIEDDFDSSTASEADYKEMYEKYKGVRNGDLIRYRAEERKAGLREAKQTINCSKLYGYANKEDGCYAVPEILDVVREIYRLSKETHDLKPVVQWLNDEKIPTTKTFFLEHGYKFHDTEVNPLWNKEKVWLVFKQEGYAQYCRYYDKCMEMDRHCERMPIVDQETYDEVNECCRYRNR